MSKKKNNQPQPFYYWNFVNSTVSGLISWTHDDSEWLSTHWKFFRSFSWSEIFIETFRHHDDEDGKSKWSWESFSDGKVHWNIALYSTSSILILVITTDEERERERGREPIIIIILLFLFAVMMVLSCCSWEVGNRCQKFLRCRRMKMKEKSHPCERLSLLIIIITHLNVGEDASSEDKHYHLLSSSNSIEQQQKYPSTIFNHQKVR